MTKKQQRRLKKPHLREVKQEWKAVGEKLAKGSEHAVRADLRGVASEAPKFVWAWMRAMYMTAVVLARMSFSVMR